MSMASTHCFDQTCTNLHTVCDILAIGFLGNVLSTYIVPEVVLLHLLLSYMGFPLNLPDFLQYCRGEFSVQLTSEI